MATKRQAAMAKALNTLTPMIPFSEAEDVKALASQKHLRHLPVPVSVWLSLVAHIRHVHTDYDALLVDGYERDAARHFVLDDINAVLSTWQATRFVNDEPRPDEIGVPDPVEDHPDG